MRQTMMLIAQLATAAGVRSLSLTLQTMVFAGLVKELERQKLRKKVVADMFVLVLRSYSKKCIG